MAPRILTKQMMRGALQTGKIDPQQTTKEVTMGSVSRKITCVFVDGIPVEVTPGDNESDPRDTVGLSIDDTKALIVYLTQSVEARESKARRAVQLAEAHYMVAADQYEQVSSLDYDGSMSVSDAAEIDVAAWNNYWQACETHDICTRIGCDETGYDHCEGEPW